MKSIKIKIPDDISFYDLRDFLSCLNNYIMKRHNSELNVKFKCKDKKLLKTMRDRLFVKPMVSK